ncbi:MAG: HIT domain-containing protein [Candidatus Paceibacterota bacterium]|jgi:diadenosine tetraphosphate (Ap4A) HIT family hydrolase
MKCVYCELPEIKAREIVRNDLAWVVPTNIPIVPGHVLIMPIRHVATVSDLTTAELVAIIDLRNRLVPVMKDLFGAEGFNYAWNEEVIAGQSVPHFHLHMLPRKQGDTGITEYEPRKFLYRPGSREATPEAELQSVAKLLREKLDR